jgi:hypothetical protein
MSEVITKSYVGVGRVWVRPYGTTGARRHVGNVSALTLRHNMEIQRQQDFTRPGGGTAIRRERVETIEAAMTWLNFNPQNWQIAMAATLHEVVSGTATAEVVTVHPGSMTPLLHIPTAITTVTENTDTTPDVYVAGTDYVMTAAGLYVPSTGSVLTVGQQVRVTYTHAAQTRLEGSMGTATVLEALFEGLNDADTQKPMIVDLWRMSVPPAEEINLIGLELGEMAVSAELLADATKGSSVSAFYRARMVP